MALLNNSVNPITTHGSESVRSG